MVSCVLQQIQLKNLYVKKYFVTLSAGSFINKYMFD